MNQNAYQLSMRLAKQLTQAKLHIATAESCTGGLLSATFTDIPGSSNWFERGFVSYSNQAKTDMLGVDSSLLEEHGAVSKQVCARMAQGAREQAQTDLAIAITGVAGPTGGSAKTPVGCVWVGLSRQNKATETFCLSLSGTRREIREQTICWALTALIMWLNNKPISVKDIMQKLNGARVFFALKPDGRVKAALNQVSRLLPRGVRATHVDDLHLTLSFLGNVDGLMLDQINQLKLAAALPRVTLTLDSLEYWPKARSVVLTTTQTPKALLEFVAELNAALKALGLSPDLKMLKPHITLARKVTRNVHFKALEPIVWHIREYCLMMSMPRGIPKYKVLQRW